MEAPPLSEKMPESTQKPLATETSLRVPVEWMTKGQGVAMDIGSETTRVLYQPKSQLQQWKMKFEGASHGKVRMFTFPTSNLMKIVEYIISNASVKGKNEDVVTEDASTTIYVTGFKAKDYHDQLKNDLEVKVEIIPEPVCLIASFNILVNNFSKEEVVHDCLLDIEESSKLLVQELKNPGSVKPKPAAAAAPKEENDQAPKEEAKAATPPQTPTTPTTPKPVPPPYVKTDKAVLPCLVAIMGEATRYVKVDHDGSHEEISINTGQGYATGLTSLILKTKTFAEAAQLAVSGDATNVNVMGKDVTLPASPMPDDLICQPLAKAAGSDASKFNREDLAAALVGDIASRISREARNICLRADLKRVYFCGEMVAQPLFRQELTRWLSFHSAFTGESVEWYFVKETKYMGVLGAYTYHLSQSK